MNDTKKVFFFFIMIEINYSHVGQQACFYLITTHHNLRRLSVKSNSFCVCLFAETGAEKTNEEHCNLLSGL